MRFGKTANSNTTSIDRAIAYGVATRCHLSVHSLAHRAPPSGSFDFSHFCCAEPGAPGGISRSRRHSSEEANHSEGGGSPVSTVSLAGSAGRDPGADGRLDASLAVALLRVVRDAVPVQAPASASVPPSASLHGVDAGDLDGLDAGGAGRVVGTDAIFRGDVKVGAAAARSSAGGAAVFAAGAKMAALGRCILISANRRDFVSALDVGVGFGDGAPVVASIVGLAPGDISQGPGSFFQGFVASHGGGSPVAVETVGSVLYLSRVMCA